MNETGMNNKMNSEYVFIERTNNHCTMNRTGINMQLMINTKRAILE